MNGGNNCERECGVEEDFGSAANEIRIDDLREEHEKYGGDLREGIHLSEDAWAKVANTDGDVEDSSDGNDAEIAAENQYRIAPWDEMLER